MGSNVELKHIYVSKPWIHHLWFANLLLAIPPPKVLARKTQSLHQAKVTFFLEGLDEDLIWAGCPLHQICHIKINVYDWYHVSIRFEDCRGIEANLKKFWSSQLVLFSKSSPVGEHHGKDYVSHLQEDVGMPTLCGKNDRHFYKPSKFGRTRWLRR